MDDIARSVQVGMIMREILFRGKRTDNGEWVEGNLVLSPNADEGYQSIVIPCYYNYMYTSDYNNDVGFETWYKVESETVGQFTGLKDMNGKTIFEGDIVKVPYFKISFEVKFVKERARFLGEAHNGELISLLHSHKDIEIIGNIWDNPELLKGE